jgi:radical SAM enzyme (TIGR01210 family)
MNRVLCELSKKIQKSANPMIVPPCTVWRKASFAHISFSSAGCAFRKAGSCAMCDYGCGESLSADRIKGALDSALRNIGEPIDELLIGTCGSVLDKREISPDAFRAVLDRVKPLKIKTLIFETHYATVTETTLKELEREFKDGRREIVIEMGLESADKFVLENCWNKSVDLDKLEETVRLVKSFGFGAVLNVMAGAPFLTVPQQIDDTVKSVKYATSIGADRANVFPVNIKKNTVIGYLYDRGQYIRPSLWALAEILRMIPDERLNRIEFSWFGDRQKNGGAAETLPPVACDECSPALFGLLEEAPYSGERRSAVNRFFNEKTELCDCYAKFSDSLTPWIPYKENDVLSRINKLAKEMEP